MSETPKRITLSREKGFKLQEASIELNGLPAVKVDRLTRFGNPWPVGHLIQGFTDVAGACFPAGSPLVGFMGHASKNLSATISVMLFREALALSLASTDTVQGARDPANIVAMIGSLRGKNLACWCKQGEPCHADVLIEFANRPVCEEV